MTTTNATQTTTENNTLVALTRQELVDIFESLVVRRQEVSNRSEEYEVRGYATRLAAINRLALRLDLLTQRVDAEITSLRGF